MCERAIETGDRMRSADVLATFLDSNYDDDSSYALQSTRWHCNGKFVGLAFLDNMISDASVPNNHVPVLYTNSQFLGKRLVSISLYKCTVLRPV